jgi:hypothetical protein
MAAEGLPVQLATRVLGMSESGYYAALSRAPSARAVRHAWLIDQIRDAHAARRVLAGRHVVAGAVQPAVDVPVDPFQGRQLDVVEASPWSSTADELGLEQTDLALGESVVVGVTDVAHAGCDTGLAQRLRERERGVLVWFKGWAQHRFR